MFNGNGKIDNFIELFLVVLFILALFLVLFKFGNWMEERPVKEPKKKKEKVKKEVVKEVLKEVKESSADISITSKSKDGVDIKVDSSAASSSTASVSSNVEYYPSQNYLYDRFVISPTSDDNVQTKKNTSFMDEDEANRLRDEKLKIKVNDVENISSKDLKKNSLYSRISEMANENLQTKEKLLEEFEQLPREMKLLLISNIIQKM